jgi:FMN phosphatase YigB (HAD superfamily)
MAAARNRPKVGLLVTDLDNTLWDWFTIWYESFSVLLARVAQASGVSADDLEKEIRVVHQRRGTSEYSYLLSELPSLQQLHPGGDIAVHYNDAIHEFRSARKRHTALYAQVSETLASVKATGVPVVAYTESLSFYSSSRIRTLGLDGVIDILYSSPDHDFPRGITPADLRSRPDEEYALRKTEHRHVPSGVLKPDPSILKEIMTSVGVEPARTVYVGDSLMKDVAMAQAVGAIDVLAAYGAADHNAGYELLRRVSHWTKEDVQREKQINAAPNVTPTHTLSTSFGELLGLFDFGAHRG